MTRPRGTVILKSTVHGHVPLDTAPEQVAHLVATVHAFPTGRPVETGSASPQGRE